MTTPRLYDSEPVIPYCLAPSKRFDFGDSFGEQIPCEAIGGSRDIRTETAGGSSKRRKITCYSDVSTRRRRIFEPFRNQRTFLTRLNNRIWLFVSPVGVLNLCNGEVLRITDGGY